MIISLSSGQLTEVDSIDAEWVAQWKWSVQKNRSGNFYAFRSVRDNGKKRTVYLHREIARRAGISAARIDHEDRNGLNNRRNNLRPASSSQNAANMKKKPGTSKFKGVSWASDRSTWTAKVCKDDRQHRLGSFKTEEQAAIAYDLAAVRFHGNHAATNSKLGLL